MADTRFILVRHAQTDAVGRVLAGRRAGFPLNALGAEAAVRVAGRLRGEAIAGVFTSPMLRARETAAAIAQAAGCEVEVLAGLDEVDFGAWAGSAFAALDGDPGWAAWNGLRSLSPTPGGETMLQAQARAVGVLQTLHAARGGGNFVLVSHADIIRSVLAHALGMPMDLMRRIEILPASISILSLCDVDVLVQAVNIQA